jgi:hypothetical protein
MTTINQRWAQERNWNKGSVAGLKMRCTSMAECDSATLDERIVLHQIASMLKDMFDNWNENNYHSKQLFLTRRK